MPLQTIDEDATFDSFATTDNGDPSESFEHRTVHGVRTDDNASIFSHSTNSTASNLVGPGRVLGNFYSSTGRRLERTLGGIAHRVGLGPEAVYEKICALEREDWRTDGKKGANPKTI